VSAENSSLSMAAPAADYFAICKVASVQRSSNSRPTAVSSTASGASPRDIGCRAGVSRASCAQSLRESRCQLQQRPGRVFSPGARSGARIGRVGRPLHRMWNFAGSAYVESICAGGAHEPALPAHESRMVWRRIGSDANFPMAEDTAEFHAALKSACDSYRPDAYAEYKAWCDRYFYLPHRQEPRGVGGIFFDELATADVAADFAFVKAVGEAFLGVYPTLVARRKATPFDDEAREKLLVKRGRYVEFNLVYDRGTKFGFSTDADPEAYLMSLPPLVRW